jgi:hypothetical protein
MDKFELLFITVAIGIYTLKNFKVQKVTHTEPK